MALQKEIDAIERSVGIDTTNLVQTGFVQNAVHTGVLMYDFVVGGGVAPGRFSILPGREGSGKSTIIDNLAAVCSLQGVPIYWFDAEAALDPNYVGRIFARYGLKFQDMLGVRDPKTGNWLLPPRIRYSQDSIGEHVFKTIHSICKMLPIVRQRPQDGVWFKFLEVKGRPGRWVEDEREGKPQFLFLIDSWPALLTEAMDENHDRSPMAEQARMFASYIRLIKAPISQRNCLMMSVNQIRQKPGVTQGNPDYEPGGTALHYFTDVRTQVMRVSPGTLGVGKGQYSEEPGLAGGVDKYVYARLKNTKNKSFTPFRESTIRIRFEHDGQPGDGICQTWDVMQYLIATGQALPIRGQALEMHLLPQSKAARSQSIFTDGERIPRDKLKEIVEGPSNRQALYKHCLQQIRTGFAFDVEIDSVKRLIANAPAPGSEPADDLLAFGEENTIEA